MSMADRVVLLCAGVIEQHDIPDALYAQPASTFSARFIGTPPMNVLELEDASAGTIRIAGTAQPLPVAARVQSIEYLGADSILPCEIGAARDFAVRVQGLVRAAPAHWAATLQGHIMRRTFLTWALAGAGVLAALPVNAQNPTQHPAQPAVELEFYYPVAVGGPITRVVDGMVADFHKENADVHITPILAYGLVSVSHHWNNFLWPLIITNSV